MDNHPSARVSATLTILATGEVFHRTRCGRLYTADWRELAPGERPDVEESFRPNAVRLFIPADVLAAYRKGAVQ